MTIATNLASFGLSVMLATGAIAQAPPATPESTPPPTHVVQHTAPVTLDGETLYYVHDFMGILSPEDRAAAASQRLKLLADDPFYSPALFSSEDVDGTTRILYGDAVIGLVTKDDVDTSGQSSAELATERINAIQSAIAKHRHLQLPRARTRAFIVITVVTLILVLLLYGLRRGHKRLSGWVGSALPNSSVTALATRLGLGSDQALFLGQRALGVLRVAVTILIFVIYLQIAFSFLPLTRGYALTVLQYLLDPLRTLWHGFLRSVGDLFTIGVLIVLTRYGLKGLRWTLYECAKGSVTVPGIAGEWAIPLYKILRLVVIALSAVMIYPYVPGSGTDAFKGLSLFAGAVFTLGATGTVGNFIGGLVAIFVGAFRIGDYVKLGEVVGVVTETTMTLTRIRTPLNEMVSVPNIAILNGQLVNYSTLSRGEGVILTTSVTIGYDAPWRTVHRLLLEAAAKTEHVETQPAPYVLQTSLDDFYVSYQLNVYTRNPVGMRFTYGALHANIQDAFNAGGVEIMSPHYASLRDGNTVTIPEDKRPKGYVAPRFDVRVGRNDETP